MKNLNAPDNDMKSDPHKVDPGFVRVLNIAVAGLKGWTPVIRTIWRIYA